jgi:hypothetical protein
MAEWNHLPDQVPDNLEIVWIRIKYYYSSPFLAEWNSGSKEFTSQDNAIVYPAWTVSRWRSQT